MRDAFHESYRTKVKAAGFSTHRDQDGLEPINFRLAEQSSVPNVC